MKARIGAAIAELDAAAWDALGGDHNPFVEHAFLAHLERSGSVGPKTGWTPAPILVEDAGRLVGAAPAYVRGDSYGEYIFDWAWADAARRVGLRYYPKITAAVPFTPATGPRLLVHPDADRARVEAKLVDGLARLAQERRASGAHVLFCLEREAAALEARGFLRRSTHQYHWRNDGYASFDDFLSRLRSEARKQIRKERRRVREQGVEIVVKVGAQISETHWRALDALYRANAATKWGRPYLTPRFFHDAPGGIDRRAVAVFATRDGAIIGGTLSFEKGAHLYGRYWGAFEHVDCLHFELCYYALIEHAIRTNKRLFEAGAQGEHKLKRGFVPVETHSAHAIADPGLSAAIARFLAEERRGVREALPEWAEHVPFKAGARPSFESVAGVEVGRAAEAPDSGFDKPDESA